MIDYAYHKIYSDTFQIRWQLTKWCNYNCSYCSQKNHDNNYISIYKILDNAKHINDIISQIPYKIDLILIGGEITFYNICGILDALDLTKLNQVHITTNFSANINNYLKLVDYSKLHNITFYLCCSFHEEYDNEIDFINKMVELKNYIYEKNNNHFYIKCETVLTNKNESIVNSFKELCNKNNLILTVDSCKTDSSIVLNQTKNKDDIKISKIGDLTIDSSIYDYCFKKDNDIYGCQDKYSLFNTLENFIPYNYYCSGSLKHLNIELDNVYAVTCSRKKCEGYLGKLGQDNIELKSFICKTNKPCNLCGYVGYDIDKNRIIDICNANVKKC